MTYTPTVRQPTGIPAAPLIMVSGLPKSGKSMLSYALATSERIDKCFVIDLGEGSADEYGQTDCPYLVVDWGSSWSDLQDTIRWCIAQPHAKDKLNAVIVDSGTEVWDGLKSRADKRARGSRKNAEALRVDPDYEVDVSMPFWNDAKETWARIVSPLKLAAHVVGVVIVTTDVVAEVVNGVPTNRKVTSYQCEKTLPRVVTAHVSVGQDHVARLIEVRSKYLSVPQAGVVLGTDELSPLDDLLGRLSPDGTFASPEVVAPVDTERENKVDYPTISPDQAKSIVDAIGSLADKEVAKGLKNGFTRQFGCLLVELPVERYDEALAWVIGKIERFDTRTDAEIDAADPGPKPDEERQKPKRGKNKPQPPIDGDPVAESMPVATSLAEAMQFVSIMEDGGSVEEVREVADGDIDVDAELAAAGLSRDGALHPNSA